MNQDFFYSKKGQRRLSTFVGQELIYDYFVDSLDGDRRKAVEEFLKENPDANKDFQKIRNGIDYAEQLRQIKVSEPLFDKVSAPASFVQVIIQKIRFDEWHPALRGGFEAAVVAMGVAVIAIFIPWHEIVEVKLANQDIVLTEVTRNETRPRGSEQEVAAREQEIFPDEGEAAAVSATPISAPAVAAVPLTTTTVAAVAKTTVPPSTLPTVVATPTTVAVAEATPTTWVEKAEKTTDTGADAKAGGFLYRGTLHLVNPHAVAPKLAEKITELGGRKAGEVELGWTRGTGAYFHFTIPEGKFQDLEAILNEYGDLKMQKEKHGRIMPKGIIRLIITAEDKK